MSPLCIILPLCSALLYAVAVLLLKRALDTGAGPWRAGFVANAALMLVHQPFWLLADKPFAWPGVAQAVFAGFLFFIGQVLTFLALNRGDVSVTTPVLGTKVIFVAVLTVLIVGDPLRASWWAAVVLTALGAVLLGWQPRAHPRHVALSIGCGLGAAFSFSLMDILVQKWAPRWGFGNFAPTMFATVGVLSLTYVPFFTTRLRDIPPQTWRWLAPGALLLAVQALGMAFTIANHGHATIVNIAYNSRGMWSIVLVWTVGHWFRNAERDQGHGVMGLRLAAASMLVAAIMIVSF